MQKVLTEERLTFGVFPPKEQKTEQPINIKDLPHGKVFDILGGIEYDTQYGQSAMLWVRIDGVERKMFLTQTASSLIINNAADMVFPYPAKVFKGTSKKYGTVFTTITDV